jgi:hemoglobin-like flavoprotein
MSLNVELLEKSFESIKEHNVQFSEDFYVNLFADFPEVKPLFAKTNMHEQGEHLYKSLQIVILKLRDLVDLTFLLKGLGTRHVKYGILPHHYPMVGSTLLKTFGSIMGSDWTIEVKQAWLDAYSTVSEIMLDGADYPFGTLDLKNTDEVIEKKAVDLAKDFGGVESIFEPPKYEYSPVINDYNQNDPVVNESDSPDLIDRETSASNFWTSGLFFQLAVVIISAITAIACTSVSGLLIVVPLIIGIMSIGFVGAFILKKSEQYKDTNLFDLTIEAYIRIPALIQGKA